MGQLCPSMAPAAEKGHKPGIDSSPATSQQGARSIHTLTAKDDLLPIRDSPNGPRITDT